MRFSSTVLLAIIGLATANPLPVQDNSDVARRSPGNNRNGQMDYKINLRSPDNKRNGQADYKINLRSPDNKRNGQADYKINVRASDKK